LRKNGIPSFTTPEEAVSTFMYMWSYAQNLELLYETPEELSLELSIPVFLREVLRKASAEGRTTLTALEAQQFLKAYKIPTANSKVGRTRREAVKAASKIGYPVVMKVLSPQITHKSQVEGVVLDVRCDAEVEELFGELAQSVEKHNPHAEFEGVVLQPMIRKKGYELLVGSKKDAHFGPVIVFGMGGIAAQLLKDVSIGFPPLNQVLARRLMERTAIYEHLTEHSHRVNLKLVEEILVKFSQLVIDFPEIGEMDINPLIVDEKDAIAVDARITLDAERVSIPSQPHEHLVITPYPKKYTIAGKLKNGTPVVIRPIKPEDEALLDELFRAFSEETMRFRFFQVIKELTHETLTRYCNIDYNREIAIVAEPEDSRERRIIGVARLILQPGQRKGEFAVAVGDQWQGLGLGSKLVDQIIKIAKDRRLKSICGDVMTNNAKMLDLCEKKGFRMESVDEEISEAVLRMED
jgi:acetyltransferase